MGFVRVLICIFLLLPVCQSGKERPDTAVEPPGEASTAAPVDEVPTELSECIPCTADGVCTPAFAAFRERHPEVTAYRCCRRRSIQDKWCEFIFEENGITIEVEFAEDGTWLETEEEFIPRDLVPEAVLVDLRDRFPQGEITKCERETTPTGIFYEIDLRFPDGGQNEYYYSALGAFLEGQNRYED